MNTLNSIFFEFLECPLVFVFIILDVDEQIM